MFNNIRISVKIPLMMNIAAILCCLTIGTLTYKSSSSALHSEVEDKLSALLASRKDVLKDYLEGIHTDISFISRTRRAQTVEEFTAAWNALPMERGIDIAPKDYLQQQYITNNPHPAGQKDNLDVAEDGTTYSRLHAENHPWFRSYLRDKGYYDIFLFDLKGNLVYSVFKELDFATNLSNGEYKDSDLGNAYRAAAANGAKEGDVFFFDFKPYAPSANVPASFISTPIFKNGQKIGVLAFQMPVAKINETLSVYEGLGETGETYAVGSDGLMRTNSRFVKEGETSILQTKIDTETFHKAMKGESGVANTFDHRGMNVISAYDSLEFLGVRWALLAEQSEDEAMDAVNTMFKNTVKIGVAVNLAIALIAFFMSRSITKPLNGVRSVLAALADGRDDVEITGTNRKDEVGDLAKAALVFKENAAEAKRLREQQRETEIRAEQDKKQVMMQLADDFESEVKGIVQMVAAAATELSQTAEGVAVSIGQSSQTSAEAASAAEQTSSNVQSVASASEELSASVQEISTQLLRSNQMVNDSVAKTEAADKQALSLSEATQRVKEVVELISDIAGKINLLSLNATIESARAGEAGKGFAVVASEVKNLANQTDKSIEEIVKVINDMNLASDDIIKSLNEIKLSINNISESSGTVAAAVEEQSATTNEIARNMQTASIGTDLIRDNLRTVSMGCSEANESAGQILQAAQELSQQAEMLNIKLENFLARIRQG